MNSACTTVSFVWLIGTFLLSACLASPLETKHNSAGDPILNDSMMGKIGASVMGESALIDKETGRIFWEGGSTSTIHASIAPLLGDLGIRHFKGTALSIVLWLSVVSLVARCIRGRLAGWEPTAWPVIAAIAFMRVTIVKVPTFSNWFMLGTFAFYLLEAWTCNTRRYLTNAISSPQGVEEYIERLRTETPSVTWKVRCFHYEHRWWLAFLLAPQLLFRNTESISDLSIDGVAPSGLLTKKVVTHCAQTNYSYTNCHDSTIAGLWKRAELSTSLQAPFTKISLSKLLVLPNSKARIDYFQQQANFVTTQGQADEYTEFSTNIQVPGFKSHLLAVRATGEKLFRLHMFWVFTCFGLSVPFRVWFARHCDVLRVTVVKETSTLPSSSSSFGKSSKSWFKMWNAGDSTDTLLAPDETFRKMMQDLSLYGTSQSEPAVEHIHEIEASPDVVPTSNETEAIVLISGDDLENVNNATTVGDHDKSSN